MSNAPGDRAHQTPAQTVGLFFGYALPYEGGPELLPPHAPSRSGCTAIAAPSPGSAMPQSTPASSAAVGDSALLTDGALKLVDEAEGGRFHYAGVSLGGAIGVGLALRYLEWLISRGFFCSDPRIGFERTWIDRVAQGTKRGTSSLLGATPARWFAADFIAREPTVASAILTNLSETDDASHVLCCGALADFDRTSDGGGISAPSCATLAGLVTGGHEHEIAMHVRALFTNGLSRTEIAEEMVHTALNAGLPPTNRALAIARDIFAEPDKKETNG